MPHEKLNIYFGMSLTLGFAAIVFTMRATFFAPVDERNTKRDQWCCDEHSLYTWLLSTTFLFRALWFYYRSV